MMKENEIQELIDWGNATNHADFSEAVRKGASLYDENSKLIRKRRWINEYKLLWKCGFKSVDLLWTSYLQAGFGAVK